MLEKGLNRKNDGKESLLLKAAQWSADGLNMPVYQPFLASEHEWLSFCGEYEAGGANRRTEPSTKFNRFRDIL